MWWNRWRKCQTFSDKHSSRLVLTGNFLLSKKQRRSKLRRCFYRFCLLGNDFLRGIEVLAVDQVAGLGRYIVSVHAYLGGASHIVEHIHRVDRALEVICITISVIATDPEVAGNIGYRCGELLGFLQLAVQVQLSRLTADGNGQVDHIVGADIGLKLAGVLLAALLVPELGSTLGVDLQVELVTGTTGIVTQNSTCTED